MIGIEKEHCTVGLLIHEVTRELWSGIGQIWWNSVVAIKLMESNRLENNVSSYWRRDDVWWCYWLQIRTCRQDLCSVLVRFQCGKKDLEYSTLTTAVMIIRRLM